MSSRNQILAQVKHNQPSGRQLPASELPDYALQFNPVDKFVEVLSLIGGRVINMLPGDDLAQTIFQVFGENADISTTIKQLPFKQLLYDADTNPHLLEKVDIALIPAQMGVGENGAVWVTEMQYQVRALPFICQHLAVVLHRKNIVAYLQDAYQIIEKQQYGFGVWIAGPSKTADIEQSLVLGAHGPKTMTVFLVEDGNAI